MRRRRSPNASTLRSRNNSGETREMQEESWSYCCWVSWHPLKEFVTYCLPLAADVHSISTSDARAHTHTHLDHRMLKLWLVCVVEVSHAKHFNHDCTSHSNLLPTGFVCNVICKEQFRVTWDCVARLMELSVHHIVCHSYTWWLSSCLYPFCTAHQV